MRSEGFTFPVVAAADARLPDGRWIDPRVVDDAIGNIAVAELMAARARERRNQLDREIAEHEEAGARARAALLRLVEDAIAPARPA